MKFGRLNKFYLQKCKNDALKLNKGNYEGLINFTENCISELQWWQKSVNSVSDIYHVSSANKLFRCLSKWLGAACGKHSTGGNWSREESSLHISVLETAAVFFAVKIYAAALSEISKHLRIDNTANLASINKQSDSNETVHLLLKMFWEFCAKKQILAHASYISSSRNKEAAKESRKLKDNLEWSLKERFFEKIVRNFGPVTIDLFASRVNCKVNRYYSYNLEPEAIGIDAFSYCWSNEIFLAFPPFAIISKVLSKIEAEMATGVLIVPLFTTQSWFTRLLRLLIHEPLLLPKSNTSLYFPYRRKIMPTLPNVALIACLVSGNCTKTKAFQMKLQRQSYSHGDQTLNVNMTHTGNNGYNFVLKGCVIRCVPL